MRTSAKGTLRALAARGVIAALPVAMVSAYASGMFASPPRLASLDYLPASEIVVSPSTVGVAESPLYGMSQQEIDEQLDELQAIGVNNIRVFVPWALVEQSPDAYDWTLVDRVMTAATARNMGVLAEVNATPTWAGPNPGTPGFPFGSDTPNIPAFTDFLQDFVDRYKTTVSAYEIWNEPNFVPFSNPIDPVAYAYLLAAAYPIIKDPVNGDPTASVVAGAVGATQDGPFTMNPVSFVQQMLAAGAGNSFDALSFHPYNDQIPFSGSCPTCPANILTPREQLDAIKTLIGTDKTIWISEYGVSTPAGTSDYAQQAAWLKDLLDYWQSYSQAGPVFVYTGRDTDTGNVDPENNFGLWTDDGTPKSAVAVLQAWIAAHPQTPTTPDTPVDPMAAIAQALQQLYQQYADAVAALYASWVAAMSTPAAGTEPAPLAVTAASAETPDVATTATETTETADDLAKDGDSDGPQATTTGPETKTTTAAESETERTAVSVTTAATPAEAEPAVVSLPAVTAATPDPTAAISPSSATSSDSSANAPSSDRATPTPLLRRGATPNTTRTRSRGGPTGRERTNPASTISVRGSRDRDIQRARATTDHPSADRRRMRMPAPIGQTPRTIDLPDPRHLGRSGQHPDATVASR